MILFHDQWIAPQHVVYIFVRLAGSRHRVCVRLTNNGLVESTRIESHEAAVEQAAELARKVAAALHVQRNPYRWEGGVP